MTVRPQLIQLDEAAQLLGCSKPTLYRMARVGRIAFESIYGRTLVRRSEIDRLVDPSTPQPKRRLPPPAQPRKPSEPLSPLAEAIFSAAQTPDPEATRRHYVYFVRCDAFVKVGVTSAPRTRLKSLAAMTPHPIDLVKLIDGTPLGERAVHRVLAEYHHRGEWFHIKPEFLEAIISLPGRSLRAAP
jgi:excisionase family DNA binding protein